MLCKSARRQDFRSAGHFSITMIDRSLGTEVLIDKVSGSSTCRLINIENILDYCLHLPGGAVSVGYGSLLEQVV